MRASSAVGEIALDPFKVAAALFSAEAAEPGTPGSPSVVRMPATGASEPAGIPAPGASAGRAPRPLGALVMRAGRERRRAG